MSACPLLVLACESLHVCTVCIWRCEHARFCVEVFLCAIYKFSFIHSFIHSDLLTCLDNNHSSEPTTGSHKCGFRSTCVHETSLKPEGSS